jgi:hypothetical protein
MIMKIFGYCIESENIFLLTSELSAGGRHYEPNTFYNIKLLCTSHVCCLLPSGLRPYEW